MYYRGTINGTTIERKRTSLMKISVVSDTHGSLQGWEPEDCITSVTDSIIHCGDLFNHGPGNPIPEKYAPKELLEKFNSIEKQLLVVKGNCDSEVDQKMLNVPITYPFLILQIDRTRILASHGHLFKEEEIISLSKKWHLNIIITGHTHKWKLETHGNFIWLNPGSTSIPKDSPSSFSLIDTDKRIVKVFNLNTKEILAECPFL